MKTNEKLEQDDVRMTLRLKLDIEAELRRWCKAYEQQTGMKISKTSAINYLLKQAMEVSHG